MGEDGRVSTRDPEPLDEADDEALHWAGDEARGQAAPRLRESATPASASATSDALASGETPEPRRTPDQTALLAATIVFGLVYLAISIGWISSAQLLVYPALDLLGEVMWQFGEFLAMVAAALWFAATLTLTPEGIRHRGAKRMLALLVGAVLLVPWPALLYWIGSMQ